MGTHDIIGGKSRVEFIAPPVETIEFTIKLSKGLGLNPLRELEDLRAMRDTGAVFNLFIGGRPVSEHKWIIASLGETVKYFDRKGEILSVDVSISLQEYVESAEDAGGDSGGTSN